MFTDAHKIIIDLLESRGLNAADHVGTIHALSRSLMAWRGPGAATFVADRWIVAGRAALAEIIQAVKPPIYLPFSGNEKAAEGREFWTSPAGDVLASAYWILYAGDLISPIAAATILFPDREISTQNASGSIAYYCKREWLHAIPRPPIMFGIEIKNPNGGSYRGSWVIRKSEIAEFQAANPAP